MLRRKPELESGVRFGHPQRNMIPFVMVLQIITWMVHGYTPGKFETTKIAELPGIIWESPKPYQLLSKLLGRSIFPALMRQKVLKS